MDKRIKNKRRNLHELAEIEKGKEEERAREFIRLCSLDIEPYFAMVSAGYNVKFAQENCERFYKNYLDQIRGYQPTVKTLPVTSDSYSVNNCLQTFKDIQKKALELDYNTGKPINLAVACRCEENIARIKGFLTGEPTNTMAQQIVINNEVVKVDNGNSI